MIYSHSGDLGDTVAACALVRELGGGELVLYPTNTRDRMTPARAAVIAPLLERQHYITGVRYSDHPAAEEPNLNLDHWRHNYKCGLNLADMYFSWIGKPHLDRDQPWLWADPNPVAEVVFARSPRYHGSFPWKKGVKKYAGRSVFLGLPDEHDAFCREFGHVPYHPTKNLLDVAEVVAAAKLVLVNQTSIFWVTEGLKRPVCLEAANGSGLENCHWDRTASEYVTGEYATLPDVDDFDERLAVLCAERDLDRSLVDVGRRRQLARLALSCASVPGAAAEVGVFRGGTAAVIAAALPAKTVHLYDTFEGCPADDAMAGGHRKGDFAADERDVRKFLAGCKVEFHPGIFPATAVDTPYSFIHLDGDLYQTTGDALDFFLPRLSPGGVIAFDDFRWHACPGVERAIRERGLQVEHAGTQAWLRK
jgi:predicted O-methyltransferase YrrM